MLDGTTPHPQETNISWRNDFRLPPELEATQPPETRGIRRDEVRLLVTCRACTAVSHSRFFEIANHLASGDVVVVNSSRTLPAALPARGGNGTPLRVHFGGRRTNGDWLVEVRRLTGAGSAPFLSARPGDVLGLPANKSIILNEPYFPLGQETFQTATRLWIASSPSADDWLGYLYRFGQPIRYGHAQRRWPLRYYQTIFARQPGSCEMPSAGRPFTRRVLCTLAEKGVHIASICLHTSLSSLECGELLPEEYFQVPAHTAHLVNSARQRGARVVAVGTTVARALETAARSDYLLRPALGWTHLVISPNHPPTVTDALLTGLHEPNASHLHLVEAYAGRDGLVTAYSEAIKHGYLWHEFGDVHLILTNC